MFFIEQFTVGHEKLFSYFTGSYTKPKQDHTIYVTCVCVAVDTMDPDNGCHWSLQHSLSVPQASYPIISISNSPITGKTERKLNGILCHVRVVTIFNPFDHLYFLVLDTRS